MNNPTYRTIDFMDVGLDADNTTILPAEKYRNSEKVTSNPLFQTDGKFDEQKFNQVYNTSVMMYNEMSQTSYDDIAAKEIELQPGSLFAVGLDDPKITDGKDQTRIVEFGKDLEANPDRNKYSSVEINRVSAGQWTPQELAQMHQTYNRKTGKWEDSPETWFGDNWFSKFFNPPVMATYDESDPEVLNGEKKVGEYKLSPEGTYYSERLDGEKMYNKETISLWDTLTKEGSWINRYDFFDSDDKEKSIAGAMFKNAAMILPAFIPGVGTYYIGASLGFQAAKLATVGARMLGGGTDSKFLNNTENWLNQFGMNVSQHSKENAFTVENFLGLAGDVFMQLKQQRWLFKQAPRMFGFKSDITEEGVADDLLEKYYKTRLSELNKKYGGKIKVIGETDLSPHQIQAMARTQAMQDVDLYRRNFQNTGSIISKAYMTGITTMESYNDAKREGASDLQATALALGYSLGEYAILNTSIGEMVMPELRIERQMLKRAIEVASGFEEEMKKAGATKDAKRSFFKKVMDLGRNLASGESHGKKTTAAIMANALGEGVEETSEELAYDAIKSIYNAYFWLTGDKQRYTAWNDMGTRYSMSFLGGVMGGGLFAGTETFSAFGPNGALANMNNESAQQHLIYLLREGKRSDIDRQVQKMTFGDKNLSASKLLGSNEDAGFAPGDVTDNMDLAIKKAFSGVLDTWEGILDGAGIKLSDSSIIDANLLKEMRYQALMKSTSASLFLSDFNKAVSDYMTAYRELKDASNLLQTGDKNMGPASDSSKPQNDNDATETNLAEKRDALNKALDNVRSYIDGRRSDELIMRGIFETNPFLHGTFKSMSFESWLQSKHGDNVSNLSKDELRKELEDYNAYYLANGKDDLRRNFEIFMNVFSRINPALAKKAESFYKSREMIDSVKALQKQLDYDTRQLNEALEIGSTGDTGQFDFILKTVSNPDRLSFGETEAEGPDFIYAPYLNGNRSPKDELEELINAEVAKLGENPDENQVIELKNKVSMDWYKGFIGRYTKAISKVLEDFSKLEYVDPQTKRQITGLYETYKGIVKNNKYDEKASSAINNIIFEMRGLNFDYQELVSQDDIDWFRQQHNDDPISPNNNTTFEQLEDDEIAEFIVTGYGFNPDSGINSISDISAMAFSDMSEIEKTLNGLKSDENGNKIMTSDAIADISGRIANLKGVLESYNTDQTNMGEKDLFDSLSRYVGLMEDSVVSASQYNAFYNEDEFSKFGDMVEEIARKPMTPIYSALDSFYIIGSRKASDVINNVESVFKTASTSPSGFTLTSEQTAHLATVLQQIEMMKSIIYASRDDNGTLANPEGFANLSNKMMKDKEGYTEANVIQGEFAEMMNVDLERTEARLRTILALSSFNNTRKLEGNRKLFLNRSAIIYRMVDWLKGINPDIVDFKEIDEAMKSPESAILKGLVDAETPNYNLSDADYIKVFDTTNKIESAIHKAFADKADDVDTMRQIIDKMNLLQPITDVFNLESKRMDPNSFVWYLANIISTDPTRMNFVLASAYNKMDIAPTPAQEMAVKGALSFLTGRKTYRAMAEAYRQSVLKKVDEMAENDMLVPKDKDDKDNLLYKMKMLNNDVSPYINDYIKNKKEGKTEEAKRALARLKFFVANSNSFNVFDSIYAISGIPGSGKTHGDIIPIIRALKSVIPDVGRMIENSDKILENVYFVTTETMKNDRSKGSIVEKLEEELPEVQVMNHDELLVDLFGSDGAKNIHKKVSADLSENGDYIAHTDVRTTKTKNSEYPSMIIVDEFTLYDQFDADAINTFAREHNIPVIFLGDDFQTSKPTLFKSGDIMGNMGGKKIDLIGKGEMTFALAEAQFMRSPKLGVSMRTNNSQKVTNLEKYRLAMSGLFRGEKNTVDFHYYTSDSGFYGDMVSSSFDTNMQNAVETIINDSRDGKIGYIYDKGSEMFKYLKEKGYIKVNSDGTVSSDIFELYDSAVKTQGMELKYYLFDRKSSNSDNDKNNVYRDLYVAMSRSRQGTVILGNYSDTDLTTVTKADSDTIVSSYDKKAITNYTQKYLDMLAAILGNEKFEALSIEPPVYDAVRKPEPPKDDNSGDEDGDVTLPNSTTTVPEIDKDNDETIPTDDGTDDGGNGGSNIPDEMPAGPVLGDDSLVRTPEGSNNTESSSYQQAIDEANNTEESKPSVNKSARAKAYIFNTFELGENVGFSEEGVSFDNHSINSINGIIKVIIELFGDDAKKFVKPGPNSDSSIFDIVSFIKHLRPYANNDMKEIEYQLRRTISVMHNAFVAGNKIGLLSNEVARVNEMTDAIRGFIALITKDKFDDVKRAKFDKMFEYNEDNVRYGIKKMYAEDELGRINGRPNALSVIRNNSVFGDRTNDSVQKLKFIAVFGSNTSDGKKRSLIEIPVMTPPNPISMYANDEVWQDVLSSIDSQVGFKREGRDFTFSDFDAMFRKDSVSKKEWDSVVSYLDKVRDLALNGTFNQIGDIDNEAIASTAKFYSTLIRMYELTMGSFVEFKGDERAAFVRMIDNASVGGPIVYSKPLGYDYVSNSGYRFTPEERLLSDVANSEYYDVSDIMVYPKDDEKYGVKAKLPFVIISTTGTGSSDPLLMWKRYKYEIDNNVTKRTTKLIYVTPPRVTFSDYMNKLITILKTGTVGNGVDKIIGNSFTSFRIIHNIFSDNNGDVTIESINSALNKIGFNPNTFSFSDDNGNQINVSEYIYSKIKPLEDIKDDARELRNALIADEMNRSLNAILFMISTNANFEGGVENVNAVNVGKIESILSERGYKGVFLFPKVNKNNKDITIFDNENNEYSIIIDGISYPYTITGRIESPIIDMDYAEILDAMDRLNPRTGTRTDISDYYDMVNGINVDEESDVEASNNNSIVVVLDNSVENALKGKNDKLLDDIKNNRLNSDDVIKMCAKEGILMYPISNNEWTCIDISDEIDETERESAYKNWLEFIKDGNPKKSSRFTFSNAKIDVVYDNGLLSFNTIKDEQETIDDFGFTNESLNSMFSFINVNGNMIERMNKGLSLKIKEIINNDNLSSNEKVRSIVKTLNGKFEYDGDEYSGNDILQLAIFNDENCQSASEFMDFIYNNQNDDGTCII